MEKVDTPAATAVAMVRAAGGVAVFAHPLARRRGRVVDERAIAELATAGLAGLEVDHPDHAPADRALLRGSGGGAGPGRHGLERLPRHEQDDAARRRDHRPRPVRGPRRPSRRRRGGPRRLTPLSPPSRTSVTRESARSARSARRRGRHVAGASRLGARGDGRRAALPWTSGRGNAARAGRARPRVRAPPAAPRHARAARDVGRLPSPLPADLCRPPGPATVGRPGRQHAGRRRAPRAPCALRPAARPGARRTWRRRWSTGTGTARASATPSRLRSTACGRASGSPTTSRGRVPTPHRSRWSAGCRCRRRGSSPRDVRTGSTNAAGAELVVVDYKTGRPPGPDDAHRSPALALYAWAPGTRCAVRALASSCTTCRRVRSSAADHDEASLQAHLARAEDAAQDVADAVAAAGRGRRPGRAVPAAARAPLRVVRRPPALPRGSRRRTGAGAVGVPGTVTRPPRPPAEPAARPVRRARRRARRARPRAARGVVLRRPHRPPRARGPACSSATSSRPRPPWRRRCGRTDGRTVSERWPPLALSACARRRPDAGLVVLTSWRDADSAAGADSRATCRLAVRGRAQGHDVGAALLQHHLALHRRDHRAAGVGAGDGQGPLGPPGGGGDDREAGRDRHQQPVRVVDGRARGCRAGSSRA